jgi:hypothetical protein
MLKRERLINKLRKLGFEFKKETPNTYLYRRGTDRAFVPKTDLISEVNVRTILAHSRCSEPEIEEFIRNAKI